MKTLESMTLWSPAQTTSDLPRLIGEGPPSFSTSTSIIPHLRFVWDTNGYYWELGVATDATRRDLRVAYQRSAGWESARLTYIFSQLIDPSVRRHYDATPLGSLFWDDYVEAEWRRIQSRHRGERVVDDPPEEREGAGEGWPWSFYQWGSACEDGGLLARWQSALVGAFSERGLDLMMSVGFLGTIDPHSSHRVAKVGYRIVAFLGEGVEPDEVIARAVASEVEDRWRTSSWD